MPPANYLKAPWKIAEYNPAHFSPKPAAKYVLCNSNDTHLLYFEKAPGLGKDADKVDRLLVLAPELLTALQDAAEFLDVAQSVTSGRDSQRLLAAMRRAKVVIKKAKGETP